MSQFFEESKERVASYGADGLIASTAMGFQSLMVSRKYMYNFSWLGRPIIKLPQDLYTYQEIMWEVQPDLVIETGIAHGGSLVFTASLLALLEISGYVTNPKVIGIDIEIRQHNLTALNNHPLRKFMELYEGSSTSINIIEKVRRSAQGAQTVLVILDSNHTNEHVYSELSAYAPLVTPGSYCIVEDTGIEFSPMDLIGDRPWGPGNSPMTAVNRYLSEDSNFEIDQSFQNKTWITSSPNGILKRF